MLNTTLTTGATRQSTALVIDTVLVAGVPYIVDFTQLNNNGLNFWPCSMWLTSFNPDTGKFVTPVLPGISLRLSPTFAPFAAQQYNFPSNAGLVVEFHGEGRIGVVFSAFPMTSSW